MLLGNLRVAFGKTYYGIGCKGHGLQFLLLSVSLRIVEVIESVESRSYFFLQIPQSLAIDHIARTVCPGARCSMNSVKLPAS